MHSDGTAVLTESAAAATAVMPGASARDQWVARCADDAAKALASGNATLLPVIASAVFLAEPERCPDCLGTAYSHNDLGLCHCMAEQHPVYDFIRYTNGEVIAVIEEARRDPGREADVWVPCQHCAILPVTLGPCDGGDLTRVPWVPDCPMCNDTGWMFSHSITAHPHMALPRTITAATLAAPAHITARTWSAATPPGSGI